MSEKAARGKKRSCQECGAPFYDLNRDPINCPLCGAAFVMDAISQRAATAAKEAEEERKRLSAKTSKKIKRVPVIAEGDVELAGDDDLVDIETDDDIDDDGVDDDTFLEDDEDDADVSVLIDGTIEGGNEET